MKTEDLRSRFKKMAIRAVPDLCWDYYRLMRYRMASRAHHSPGSVASTFTEIHDSNFWRGDESVSGTGSDLLQTQTIRNAIPELIRKFGIKSMIDIPCGDFHWMKLVDLNGVKYLGADIVPGLVARNREKFAGSGFEFRELNLIQDILPPVDLVFCRDCLVHFSYADIALAIRNLKASKSKYLLTTTFVNRKFNFDIATGGWRPINLSLKPFLFLKPVEVILENCTEGNGKSYDKSLALFRISELPDVLLTVR